MALVLPAALTNLTAGSAVMDANSEPQLRALFPGISQQSLAALVNIVELEGAVQEQRLQFTISGQVGTLKHYYVVYTPTDKLLRWRQILATVSVPQMYTMERMKVGQKRRGGPAGLVGKKKAKWADVPVPRGLTQAEIDQVQMHLLNSVRQVIGNHPIAT